MIPYLFCQMLLIMIIVIIGIPLAVALFYLNHTMDGSVVSIFVLFSSILSVFFCSTVNKAYITLTTSKYTKASTQETNFEEEILLSNKTNKLTKMSNI